MLTAADTIDEVRHRRLNFLRKAGYWSLLFWPAFILAGLMAFGAPGSGAKLWPYLAFVFAIGYGALPFIAPPMARSLLDRGFIKAAYVVGAIPASIVPFLFLCEVGLFALFSIGVIR